ncbi:GNAT family N-acetyltransferase [Catellatospora sichuanensis]|uniref:GNAT family N-acetyltransferase n=1 Tax=Catellatospora sichuanensis TaxID=1969805 RepID=UPI001182B579|nr:GNAT family N-acetyltransferase [Catellatospora sichuanensis]
MIEVRHTTSDDAETIAMLLNEVDRYYGATELEPLDTRVAQIHDFVFTGHARPTVLLAHVDGKPAGFASCSLLWPAAVTTRSMYLKELFVVEGARRRGVARALIDDVIAAARGAGCSRVEWTADADNPAALEFYRAIGVEISESKVFYRLPLT